MTAVEVIRETILEQSNSIKELLAIIDSICELINKSTDSLKLMFRKVEELEKRVERLQAEIEGEGWKYD